jgi:hypothetical protein
MRDRHARRIGESETRGTTMSTGYSICSHTVVVPAPPNCPPAYCLYKDDATQQWTYEGPYTLAAILIGIEEVRMPADCERREWKAPNGRTVHDKYVDFEDANVNLRHFDGVCWEYAAIGYMLLPVDEFTLDGSIMKDNVVFSLEAAVQVVQGRNAKNDQTTVPVQEATPT